jgi:seryl-tRNA synthetase
VCLQQSDAMHDEIIQIEKDLFNELGLHFRVLDMPSGDLGRPAYRKVSHMAY